MGCHGQNELGSFLEPSAGTAGCGPACPVVWGGGAKHSPLPDYAWHECKLMGLKSPARCPAVVVPFIRETVAKALDEINCDSARNGGEVQKRSGSQLDEGKQGAEGEWSHGVQNCEPTNRNRIDAGAKRRQAGRNGRQWSKA